MWLRILDIRKALEARTYDVPFTLTVESTTCISGLGGRFVLDGGPDEATAPPRPPTPTSPSKVGALGGARRHPWFARRGCRGADPCALRTFGAALRTATAPWCNTDF